MRITVSGLALVLLAACAPAAVAAEEAPAPAPASAAAFGIRPYPVAPGVTEMTLAWTANAPVEFTLRYGRGEKLDRELKVQPRPEPIEYQPRAKPAPPGTPAGTPPPPPPEKIVEQQYVARLAELEPDSQYSYEVSGAGLAAQGSFRTFPTGDGEFTIVAYGDTQHPERHQMVAAGFAAHKPRFLLHVGDLTDYGGHYPLWNIGFFRPLGETAAGVPVQPARGNHDSSGFMLRLFPRPENRLYYSFDCGNAHFVCLDVFCGGKGREAMLKWCEEDLAASRARWKIVYGHFPVYDAGAHGTAWGRADFLPLFRKHGVDLVFSGHTHTYQRTLPMFTAGENDGHPITFIVTGGGGGGLMRLARDPHLAAGFSGYHFMVLNFSDSGLRGRVLIPDGKELDSFAIAKAADGSLAADYVKRAVPEAGFGELRALVAPGFRGLALSDDLRSGRPASVEMNLAAGEQAMKFTVQLESRAAEAYAMEPVSGEAPAGGAAPVKVSIRLREAAAYADPAAALPVLRLECVFEIGGRTASVFSNRLIWQPPEATAPVSGGRDDDEN